MSQCGIILILDFMGNISWSRHSSDMGETTIFQCLLLFLVFILVELLGCFALISAFFGSTWIFLGQLRFYTGLCSIDIHLNFVSFQKERFQE